MAEQYQKILSLPTEIEKLGSSIGRRVLRRAASAGAAKKARGVFDHLSGARYSLSGKSTFSVVARSRVKSGVLTVGVYTGLKKIPADHFPARPSITTDTTGSNRQTVYYSIKKGSWEYVDRGLIWNEHIFSRIPGTRKIQRTSAGVRTAEVLGEFESPVYNELQSAVLSAIDKALKERR